MKLIDRLTQTELGGFLDLARSVTDHQDFESTFSTRGDSGKEAYKKIGFLADFFKENRVFKVVLPYVSNSEHFASALERLQEGSDFPCRVVLIVPADVEIESLDRGLLERFMSIKNVSHELRQAGITDGVIDEDGVGSHYISRMMCP